MPVSFLTTSKCLKIEFTVLFEVMLTNQQLTKFQLLYKNRFGKEISKKEAYEQGEKLMSLVEAIYKPMTEGEFNQLQERREATTVSSI